MEKETRKRDGSSNTPSVNFNAPVGLIAFDNATVTNKSSGDEYVAGRDLHVNQATGDGKKEHDQATSSDSRENVTQNTSGHATEMRKRDDNTTASSVSFNGPILGGVAFGNANMTDLRSGNTYVAGRDLHINRPDAPGQKQYDQASANSSRDNVSRDSSGPSKDGHTVDQSVAAGFSIHGQANVKIDDGNVNVTHN